jgi:hypothetical protein
LTPIQQGGNLAVGDRNKYQKIMREMRENAEIIMRSFSKAKRFRKIWTEKEDWGPCFKEFFVH